jgi:tripartite-type tricarboxylate transporter receptor subunit TctC
MQSPTRRACIAIALAVSAGYTAPAAAQNYPSRPIRLVVTYPPSGGADVIARAIAQRLGDAWGQQVVIDNRPGGGANIGAELVARATPDGHTLLIVALAHSVNVSLYSKLAYDPLKDFVPVIFLATVPNILVVHPAVPARTTRELLDLARAKPGQMNYASTGSGGPQHLGMELFKTLSGVQFTHIPYKGAAPALTDIISGQIQTMFGNMISTLPHVRSGRLRALAVSTGKRASILPETPTVAESGVAGFESGSWFGVAGPAGMPRPIVDRINLETNRILGLPDLRERLATEGAELGGGTPESFGSYLRAEVAKWAKVVRFAQMRVD